MISLQNLVILVLVLAVVLLVLLIVSLSSRSRLRRHEQQTAQLLQQQQALKASGAGLQEQLYEIRTGSLGMGDKVKDLIGQLQQTQLRQEKLEEQDPELRLYSKASRMACGSWLGS